jgi:glycosyltransferase involved in cell wall biosynthesis
MANTAPRVSVVVPTHNKATYLELSLQSWCNQTFRDYELIIVDDGSTDSTPEIISSYRTLLPMHAKRTDNHGRAAARNHGLAIARGDLVVFCDDDRVVHSQFLEAHVAAHAACPRAAAVIGWQHALMTHLSSSMKVPAQLSAALLLERPHLGAALRDGKTVTTLSKEEMIADPSIVERRVLPDPWFENYVGPVHAAYGQDITDCPLAWTYGATGNLSVPRDWVIRVGGFDTAFVGWGLEDIELHYRLTAAGIRTLICPAAVNYHQNHPRNELANKWNWLRNAKTLLAKHPTLEVALHIQSAVTNYPLTQVFAILREARNLEGTLLLAAYRQLAINHAGELTRGGDALAP